MPLILRRETNEAWLQAALRRAKPWGLERSVAMAYGWWRKRGKDEMDAAILACEDWDILDYMEETDAEEASDDGVEPGSSVAAS